MGVTKNLTKVNEKEYVYQNNNRDINSNLTESISKTESHYYEVKNRLGNAGNTNNIDTASAIGKNTVSVFVSNSNMFSGK